MVTVTFVLQLVDVYSLYQYYKGLEILLRLKAVLPASLNAMQRRERFMPSKTPRQRPSPMTKCLAHIPSRLKCTVLWWRPCWMKSSWATIAQCLRKWERSTQTSIFRIMPLCVHVCKTALGLNIASASHLTGVDL